MSIFSYAHSNAIISAEVAESHRQVWNQLSHSGTWWTADEMLALAQTARSAFAQRHQPPWQRTLPAPSTPLPKAAITAVERIATSPSTVDRSWVDSITAEIGDGQYVELVAVTATIAMIDIFAAAAGVEVEPLPRPADNPGQPSQQRPDGLGDIGAHVEMLEPFGYANVARALSLVPSANQLFRTTSVPMYSAPGMGDLVWDTPLQRTQVELVASRVAALNECFY